MFRSTLGAVFFVLAALVLVSDATAGKDKGGKDKGGTGSSPTVVWDWTVYEDNGKLTKGTWKVRGFVIWNGKGIRVGSYKDVDAGHVKVEIDDGRIAGDIDLTREEGSSEWSGELTRKRGGGNVKIKVVFRK
jgi:hypothetical protein